MKTIFHSVILIALLGSLPGFGSQNSVSDNTIIATVNQVPIEYREIKIHPAKLAEYEKLTKNGRIKTADRVELRHQLETNLLIQRIKRIVRDQKKQELNIELSEKETEQAQKSALTRFEGQINKDGTLSQETSKRQINMYKRLISALEAVINKKMDPEAVYFGFIIEEFYEPDQWKSLVLQYDTREKIESLKSILKATENNEIRIDYGSTAVAALEVQKLNSAIDQLIADKNPDFKRFLEMKESGNLLVIGDFPANYHEQMRLEWWVEQYRSADIEIHLEEFESVERLFKTE